jgi:curved DNA-binding protein CbpA
MTTLYNLLGARPDDDAVGLGKAFRKAAKASRSNFHAGNPDAPKRFRQIVEAYDVLRDAERRAVYDRLLEIERRRGRLSAKLKRTAGNLAHHIVSDAIGVVSLVVVLAGGHTLFAYLSKTPVNAVEAPAYGPAEVAGMQPGARTGMAGDRPVTMPSGAPAWAVNSAGAPEAGKRGPASGSAVPGIVVARTHDDVPATVDRDQPRSGKIRLSSNGHPKSSLSDLAASGDKHGVKTAGINTNDTKTPDMKMTGKPPHQAKRRAKNHTPVKQASLEDRKTSSCSSPRACAGDEPPLFGVGF